MSVHDRWAGARQGEGQRWEVRWRAAGKQHKRRFPNRTQADRFDARISAGVEVTPNQARKLTVEQMMQTWWDTKQNLKQKTLDAYTDDMREVVTAFGDRPAASVKPSEIRLWAARDRGVSLRTRSLIQLRQAYKIAVADGLLQKDPTEGIPLPKASKDTERVYLSWDQLKGLAEAAAEYAPLVWVLGTCGLRLGEAVGLQHKDIDRTRGRLTVRRSVVETSKGKSEGKPKSGKSREVPIPAFVLAMIPDGNGYVFRGFRGDRLDGKWWRAFRFQPAAHTVGLGKITYGTDGSRTYTGMHPHELRHTAASLAIQAGADVLTVQRMLGHASAAITLGIYAHLWDKGLDEVAERMHQAHSDSNDEEEEAA